MTKLTRCPFCGALNAADADWCGQCLARFTEPGVEYGTAESDEKESPPGDEEEEEEGEPPAASARSESIDRGAFKVTDEGISWVCSRCETVNSIDANVCAACGTAFADVLRPSSERSSKDPGTAALLSLFFPGAGHAYVGLWAQAAARAVLSTWVILVAVFSVTEGTGGGAAFVAVLFGLSTVAMWAIGAHDAYREAASQEQLVLLKGRRLIWVVAGLLMTLVIVVSFAGANASR